MIAIVDNYDSFTYNLVQMLRAAGVETRVDRNDEIGAAQLLELGASGVILSPGPGVPAESRVTADLLAARPDLPILGVCLGHQAIAAEFGAVVERAAEPVHGKACRVRHDGSGAFAGLPSPFLATRYHSLRVAEGTLPESLVATAWSDDGTLMGIAHRELPYWGVQFHPESVLTEGGGRILENFFALCGEGELVEATQSVGGAA